MVSMSIHVQSRSTVLQESAIVGHPLDGSVANIAWAGMFHFDLLYLGKMCQCGKRCYFESEKGSKKLMMWDTLFFL